MHVAARHGEDGSQEYLCKWRGLPYSECTWEDGQLVGCWYQDIIDAYHERNATDTIPNKNAKVKNNTILLICAHVSHIESLRNEHANL